jgi:hypothetical protein
MGKVVVSTRGQFMCVSSVFLLFGTTKYLYFNSTQVNSNKFLGGGDLTTNDQMGYYEV